MPRRVSKLKFSTPEELKDVIEQIFINRRKGWTLKKICDYFKRYGLYEQWVYRVLQFKSPEEAFEHFSKTIFSEEKESEEVPEDKTEKSVSMSASRKILDEVKRYVRNLAVEQLKRILEQGMVVDMLYEEIMKARQEKFKKLFIEEAVKREILNEALVYYLAGKINREKLARVVLATMFI